MRRRPTYRNVHGVPGSVDQIYVTAFDFNLDTDSPAAAFKVNGYTEVQVFAPADRVSWTAKREQAFRDAVRDVARRHPVRGASGAVTVVFDPTEDGADDGTGAIGELVDREV